MKKNTIKKRKLHKDCWALDYSFYRWLDQHLPVYLHDADKIVDLTFYTFDYKGKHYTQKEAIERMIVLLQLMRGKDDLDEGFNERRKELLDLWGLVCPLMWW